MIFLHIQWYTRIYSYYAIEIRIWPLKDLSVHVFFVENVVRSVSAVASGSDSTRGGLARHLPHEGTRQGAEVKGHTIKKVKLLDFSAVFTNSMHHITDGLIYD